MEVKKASADDDSGTMQFTRKAVAPTRRKSVRKAPEYTFSVTQQNDGMEL